MDHSSPTLSWTTPHSLKTGPLLTHSNMDHSSPIVASPNGRERFSTSWMFSARSMRAADDEREDAEGAKGTSTDPLQAHSDHGQWEWVYCNDIHSLKTLQ